jgi:hypothetical protein
VLLNSKKLATTLNGFICEEGQFVVAPKKVYVYFDSCDGIVKIIWRGNQDHHGILPSRTTNFFIIIGISCQISNKLMKAIATA